MNARNDESGAAVCWPSAEHVLCLRAALLSGPHAVVALEGWLATADLERLAATDLDAYRLLPLMVRNLSDQGYVNQQPAWSMMNGAYRQAWARNQLLLQGGAAAVGRLREAGLETLILDGAALAERYYGDLGARPLEGVRILVRRREAAVAYGVLKMDGWRPRRAYDPGMLDALDHVVFEGPEGRQTMMLHWHAMPRHWRWEDEEGFWERGQPFVLAGESTRALSDGDQLLRICAGRTVGRAGRIRWIADAAKLVEAAEERIDWQRLAADGTALRLTRRLACALSAVRELLDLPVPEAVVEELRSRAVGRAEGLAWRLQTAERRTGVDRARAAYLDYTFSAGRRPPVVGFLRYLRHRWSLGSVAQVPGHGLRMVLGPGGDG